MNPDPFDNNPFAAPEMMSWSGETDPRPAAAIRRAFLDHEASIHSVGLLYLIGCGLCIASGFFVGLMALGEEYPSVPQIVGSFIIIGLGFMQGMIGSGLRRLKRWTRIPVMLLACVGLLVIPIGTIINGYILYLVLSSKGATVFSDEYKEVIRQTPDIRYRTSIVVWIFLGLLAVVILVAMFGVALS
jgi:hypothetical protein